MIDCDCTIPGGGFCPRHGVHKTENMVALCQQGGKFWQAWERGKGPSVQPTPANAMPPLAEQAWNLATAIGVFIAAPGLVDSATYEARLAICDACEKRDEGRCSVCGCWLKWKARARVWQCPDEPPRWLAVEKPRKCGCGRS